MCFQSSLKLWFCSACGHYGAAVFQRPLVRPCSLTLSVACTTQLERIRLGRWPIQYVPVDWRTFIQPDGWPIACAKKEDLRHPWLAAQGMTPCQSSELVGLMK
jgi:hypothetical protein